MSNTMWWLLAALTLELLLILLVLLGISWWRNRAARQRDTAAIAKLVGRVKAARPDRQAAIGQLLQTGMGMSGEALEQARLGLWRAETVLLQRFAAVYRKRDAGAAEIFDTDVCAALEPYLALQAGGSAADVGPVDPEELERLRAENERLTEELRITMETVSRMLSEYSTMFAGAEADGVAPLASLDGDAGASVESDVPQQGGDRGHESEGGALMATVDTHSSGQSGSGRVPLAPVALDVATEEAEPDMASGVDDDALDDAATVVGEAPVRMADAPQEATAADVAATDEGQRTQAAPDRAAPSEGGLATRLEEGQVEVMTYDDEPETAPAEAAEDLFDPMELIAAGDDAGPGFDPDLFDAVEPPRDESSLDETEASLHKVQSHG